MVARSRPVRFRILENGKAATVASIHANTRNTSQLQRQAIRWQYIVRQRNRWSTNEDGRRNIKEQAVDTLKELGISRTHLARLGKRDSRPGSEQPAAARLIEISIPWRSEKQDWWARIMPWEYLLSAATKEFQAADRKLIVRRLDMGGRSSRPSLPKTFSILEASPGVLRDKFDFEAEQRLVRSTLLLDFIDLHRECGRDPDLQKVAKWLKRNRPSVLHISGVDTHLGKELLHEKATVPDGLYLGSTKRTPQWVNSYEFAEAAFGDGYKPHLVAFNVWHSGSRLAPLSVSQGAQAALGFENTFDDSVAELFFAQFYNRLVVGNWDYAKAFQEAIDSISPYGERIRGSGIVLWTRSSLLDSPKSPGSGDRRRVAPQATVGAVGVIADPHKDDASRFISINVTPHARLNYAHLHNSGSLLESLSLELNPCTRPPAQDDPGNESRQKNGGDTNTGPRIVEVKDIDITVSLSTGADALPYKSRVSLTEQERVVDIARTGLEATDNHSAGGIFVPLTSELMRSVDESILTSLHVDVRWHDQCLFNRSFPVRLTPVDEWRFEEEQIIWMSSFVQPRDEAVSRIIDSAQRYLACLADDTSAGFGGYQAYDPDSDDPWRGVDQQVQAIWMALVLDYRLGYINPPPSYSENAQRLRTPGRILDEKRGTCVDLALLVAACLEWIEIYPVLFNLNDHAFPGYWRNPEEYDRFQQEPSVELWEARVAENRSGTTRSEAPPPWYSAKGVYSELRSLILPARKPRDSDERYHARCSLIPIESTFLTRSLGFRAAVDEARSYFSERESQDFHSMIDVTSSRLQVTPIPLSTTRKGS